MEAETTESLMKEFVLVPREDIGRLKRWAAFILLSVFGVTWVTAWGAAKTAIQKQVEYVADIHRFRDQAQADLLEIEHLRELARQGHFNGLTLNHLTLKSPSTGPKDNNDPPVLTIVDATGQTVFTITRERLEYINGPERAAQRAQFGITRDNGLPYVGLFNYAANKHYVRDSASQ